MEIKQILATLSPYNVSLKIVKGCYLVSIVFDKKWQVAKPKNKKIHYQEKEGISYYWGDMAKIEFDDIYNEINDVIVKNKEIAMTLKLLNEKLEELKKMFTKLPYEKLKYIKFIIDEPVVEQKKRPGRKANAKKVTESKTNEIPSESGEQSTIPVADNTEQQEMATKITMVNMPLVTTLEPVMDNNETDEVTSEDTMDSLMAELG